MIENPSAPLAKNAGRILQLKETWRITDESGEFYFKHPYGLEVAANGNLFLADERQLLRFGPGGKFRKNLYKEGQGPGEISRSLSFRLDGDLLLVKDNGNRRIFLMDAEGLFRSQLERETGQSFPVGARPDGLIVRKSKWPTEPAQTGKLLPIREQISLVSRDGTVKKQIHVFPYRWFVTPSRAIEWDPNLVVLSDDGRFLVGCHSRDYLIELLDIDASRVIRAFRRAYSPAKHVQRAEEEAVYADFYKAGMPVIENEPDVCGLFVNGQEIWVETSTKDPAKGDLYDVFDFEGRFLDSFHLGPGRTLLKARGKDVYTLEKDNEANYLIVKYRLN